MPRRKRCRKIGGNPNAVYFKPNGIPKRFLEEVCLDIDEWEAIRLKDFSELDQNDCAKKMKVSQPTFHRIITSAHKKIADSLINGKAIKLMS